MTHRRRRSSLVRILLTVPICLGLLAGSPFPAHAAPGDLDTSFDSDGIVTTSIGSTGAQAVAVQPDGKIIVVGSAIGDGGSNDFAIVRYNENGSLDTSFDTDGIVLTDFSGGADQAKAIAVQSDGKIVVAGVSYASATGNDFAVARYSITGTLDSGFGGGDGVVTTDIGGSDDGISGMVLQSDGAIVVAGHADMGTEATGYDFALARYTSAGVIDTVYGDNGKVTTHIGTSAGNAGDIAYALAIQSDDKVVVAGYAVMSSTGPDFALVRYTTDGSEDATFGGTGIVTTHIGDASATAGDYATAVVVQPDGKIVATGYVDTSSAGVDVAVVRYTPSGALDNDPTDGFGGDGIVTTHVGSAATAGDYPYGVAVQHNGKVVVAGAADITGAGNDFMVLRYTTAGAPDTSFDSDGKVTTTVGAGESDDTARSIAIAPDGSIVVAGTSAGSFAVARYEGDPIPVGLEIPIGPYTVVDGKISIPVNLAFSLVDLGAVAFSLDYDDACLTFDPTDGDLDGLPDTVGGIPAGISATVLDDAGDADGELDIGLTDATEPIEGLPVGTLITVTFTANTNCDPGYGNERLIDMSFSQDPAPSFSDTQAAPVMGTATASTISVIYTPPPSGINLSNSSVAENLPAGTEIGVLSIADPVQDETYTYTVVPDVGDADSFTVTGDRLETNAVFNFEGDDHYTVTVHAEGSLSTSLDEMFDIFIANGPDAPTAIALDNSTVPENSPAGTVVGSLTTTDEDGSETHTYTLEVDDAGAFQVVGAKLLTQQMFDFETANQYTVTVRVTDKNALAFDQQFVVDVTNVNEAPIAADDVISPLLQIFVGGSSSIDVRLNDTDPDAGTTLIVSAVGEPGTGGTSRDNDFVYFDPPDNANGVTDFTYTVSDGAASPLYDTATVTVTYVADDPRGDCNADGAVNAADFVATVLEHFDAPSEAPWWEIYAAGYAGSPQGCNSNADGHADIADLICTVRLFFGSTCQAASTATAPPQPALSLSTRRIGQGVSAEMGLQSGEAQVAALAFELHYDPQHLQVVGDADTIAGASMAKLPGGIQTWIDVDDARGRIQVVLAAVTWPIVPLPSGELVRVSFTKLGQGSPVFSLHNVSAGDASGASLPVLLPEAEEAARPRILLPMTER